MKYICVAVLLGTFVWCTTALAQESSQSLNDVWLQNGGARMQYDALTQPRQTNGNGASWHDPAYNRRMPALHSATPAKGKSQRTKARNRTDAPKNVVSPKTGTQLTPSANATGQQGSNTVGKQDSWGTLLSPGATTPDQKKPAQPAVKQPAVTNGKASPTPASSAPRQGATMTRGAPPPVPAARAPQNSNIPKTGASSATAVNGQSPTTTNVGNQGKTAVSPPAPQYLNPQFTDTPPRH